MKVLEFPQNKMSHEQAHECMLEIALNLERVLELTSILQDRYTAKGRETFECWRLHNQTYESLYKVEDMLGVDHD